MPDTQALELLLRSVKRFNEWKSVRPGAVVLDGACLADRKLTGVDLSGASLKDAVLSGADLSGGNLRGAVLYRATAVGAVLARARMDDAYAADACLENADLSQIRANLTNFSRANLRSARFDHARLLQVNFTDADLSGARMVGALLVGTQLPDGASVDLKDAVIEEGRRLPQLPTVDFRWISEDGLMFTIGHWIPRPELSDDEVPAFVKNLRKFNRGDQDVINGYGKLIAKISRIHHLLACCDCACAVPASKVENTETPVTALVHEVARLARIRDGASWLVRHKSVLPAGFLGVGGNEGRHLDSVRVAHSDLVDGRTVLLLDDFIDTGSTMRACRHLLHACGAKRVLCLALALRLHGDDPEIPNGASHASPKV